MVGRGPALDCYRAAEIGRRDRSALDRCDLALAEDFLTTRDRAATLVNRAIIYLRRGQSAHALTDLDDAIQLQPDMAEAHVVRGGVLAALRRYREAVEEFTRALSLDMSQPERAYFQRAGAYEELGEARAAYHDYRRAAELAPGWRDPHVELARFQVVRQ
jgi:tetratricopeptide (TPR) repeat protein